MLAETFPQAPHKPAPLVRARAAAACSQAWYLVSGGAGAGVPAPVSSRRAATSARLPLASAIQTSRKRAPSAARSVACRSSQTCSPSTSAVLAVVASDGEAGITGRRLEPQVLHRLLLAGQVDGEARAVEDGDDRGLEQVGFGGRCRFAQRQRRTEIDRGLSHQQRQIVAGPGWQQVEEQRLGGFARFDRR